MFAAITNVPPVGRVCALRHSGRAMQLSRLSRKAGMRLACSEQRAAMVM